MSSSRPSLLFIARSFPPVATIASIRLSSIAGHLAELGWKVTVLAPDPELLREPINTERVRELEDSGVRILKTDMRGRCLLPAFFHQGWVGRNRLISGVARRLAVKLDLDDGIGWIGSACKAASVLRPGDVDLILASGAPFSSFVIARRLSRTLGCPYVLDYRDPWTQRDFRKNPARPWTRRTERLVCDDAAAIVHVSPMLVPRHVQEFGGAERNHSITNGFDPVVLDAVTPCAFDHRAIVYAGRFYPPHRVIQPVLDAVRLLRDEPDGQWSDLRFHYYGVDSGQVRQAAQDCGASDFLVDHGKVPQKESFSASKGAAVNVVVTSVIKTVDQGILGNLPGKLFEVIGLGSPVLLVSPDGSQARMILDQTRSGLGVSGDDPVRIAEALKELLGRAAGRSPQADAYSWPRLARQLDTLLRSLLPASRDGSSS